MSSALDLLLIDAYTAGAQMPAATQAGYDARANAAGTNIDYVAPAQVTTGSDTWNGTAECILVGGSGSRTIVLPRADIVGRVVEICDAAGNSGSGTITIDPSGTDTINGSTTITIVVNYDSRRLRYSAAGVWIRTPG